MKIRKYFYSYFKNIGKAFFFGLKALFYLMKTKEFWKKVLRFFFVDIFWEMLGATVIFLLMIPAMRSGGIPIWLAFLGSLIMGLSSRYLSATYDNVNPFRKNNEG